MEIAFLDETNTVSQEKINEIDELLQYAADYLKLPEDTEMSVSFALEEETEEELPIIFDDEMPAMPRNLGDIMISVERAKEQASEYGHSYDRELGFLALHGFLHINGYDHMTPEDEKEMFGLQKEILDAYGLKR